MRIDPNKSSLQPLSLLHMPSSLARNPLQPTLERGGEPPTVTCLLLLYAQAIYVEAGTAKRALGRMSESRASRNSQMGADYADPSGPTLEVPAHLRGSSPPPTYPRDAPRPAYPGGARPPASAAAPPAYPGGARPPAAVELPDALPPSGQPRR